MSAQKKHIFKISQMKIEGNVICWDDHALRISDISQVWAGPRPQQPFPGLPALVLLFIALAGRHPVDTVVMLVLLALCMGAWAFRSRSGRNTNLVNLGLSTGEFYSFVPPNDGFGRKLCRTLTELMEGSGPADYDISFQGDGEITARMPPEPEPEPRATVLEAGIPAGKNGQLISELQKLYQCYTNKNNAGSEILDLINDTSRLIERNDKEGIKAAFTKFITLGLINDCNELGLDSLIQEIMTMLY